MLVNYATDFRKSAENKLAEMGVLNGEYKFPFATEYRQQGAERKYHIFSLVDGRVMEYGTLWFPAPAR